MNLSAAASSVAYRAAWAMVGRVPPRLADAAITRFADVLVDRRGPGVRQLARNMRRVLGEAAGPASLHAVTRAALRSYGRYWYETFRLRRMDLDEVATRALAGTSGTEQIREAQRAGRGIILALPHSGNWDIAGLSMSVLVGGITTVAERLEPESIYRRFVTHRESLGMEVLPLTGAGSEHTGRVLVERLEAGRMVCLLADRDLAGNGIPVTLFGEETTMPPGPALLAARTGAALCPVHLAYTDDGFVQYIGAPLELAGARLADQVKDGTRQLAAVFERRIAMFPADWHMMQPIWPVDRAGRIDDGSEP